MWRAVHNNTGVVELTTLVVIGTDYTGVYKYNYHTIMGPKTTKKKKHLKDKTIYLERMLSNYSDVYNIIIVFNFKSVLPVTFENKSDIVLTL